MSQPSVAVPSDAPAINDTPVELDGSATISPEDVKKRNERGLADDEEGNKKRDEILEERKRDPGVIVDVPSGLTAEEVQAVVGERV